MNILMEFFMILKEYLREVLPFLFIGFLLSGLIYEFVPTQIIEKHLGGKGIKPIFYSTFVGALLPICCIGSLPIAVSLHQKGAKLGSVLAFLVATPTTSLTALLVTYSLLGVKFTIFIFFSVILMGLIVGILGNAIKLKVTEGSKNSISLREDNLAMDPVCEMRVNKDKGLKAEYKNELYYFCSAHCKAAFEKDQEKYIKINQSKEPLGKRFIAMFKYIFFDMVREMGWQIFLGLILAALISTISPLGEFIKNYFSGGLAYLFSLFFGLMMYICSTASVPLVHAFVSQGMNIGAAMVLLIAGPVTSWGTILVLKKSFGGETLILYLATVSIFALSLGYIFSQI